MNFKGLNHEQELDLIPDHTFILGLRGSLAHGTYTPTYGSSEHDDKDIMGACFGPRETYLGFGRFEQRERMITGSDGVVWDSVVYEIRKFFSLLLKGNPNVLCTLFLDENMFLYKDDIGKDLISHRDWFIGKHVYAPFKGYASSQLSKMDRNVTANIGAVRKALVEEFGFDVKHSSHLIRLLRMGIEFLTEGVMHVHRHDAQELIDIKNGLWSREEVLDESKRLFGLLDEAYIRSTLPLLPERDKVEEILGDYIMTYLTS